MKTRIGSFAVYPNWFGIIIFKQNGIMRNQKIVHELYKSCCCLGIPGLKTDFLVK